MVSTLADDACCKGEWQTLDFWEGVAKKFLYEK
jgi:hypothetical protein